MLRLARQRRRQLYRRSMLQSIRRGIEHTTRLLEYSMGAIKLSEGPGTPSKTTHMDVKYHYVREKVEDETI